MAKRKTVEEREIALREKVSGAEQTLNQYKARLHQLAAKRAQAEKRVRRQERANKLFLMGGLCELAGVSGLDKDTLLGALLSIKRKMGDEDTLRKWGMSGSFLHAQQRLHCPKSRAAQGFSLLDQTDE